MCHELWILGATYVPYFYPHRSVLKVTEEYFPHALLWFQYDALQYLHIAHDGYGNHPSAFYPLLPLLISLTVNRWVTLVIIQAVFAADLYFLSRYFKKLPLTDDQHIFGLALFAFNPSAIFYSTLYPESVLMLLALLSLLAALDGHYVSAGIWAFWATLAHPTGALLGVMPLVVLVQGLISRNPKKMWGAILWGNGIALALAGFSLYALINWHTALARGKARQHGILSGYGHGVSMSGYSPSTASGLPQCLWYSWRCSPFPIW